MALHRLASVTVAVPDVEAAAGFYRDFGLREARPGVFATSGGGEQLFLEQRARRGLLALGVEADSPDDLERIARALAQIDVPATRSDGAVRGIDPGSGVVVDVTVAPRRAADAERATPFNGPGRIERSGRAPGIRPGGARPRKLGHAVLATPDLDKTHAFFAGALGFKVSDELHHIGWFLRCSTDHHNLLIQRAPVAFLHHTAWEVADVDEIGRGARELLTTDPARHTWGFGRHHVGSNFFWYFRDPAGNFAEYYSDLDVIPDDAAWSPEVWEGSKGLFAWGPPPPPSFLMPDDLAALMAE